MAAKAKTLAKSEARRPWQELVAIEKALPVLAFSGPDHAEMCGFVANAKKDSGQVGDQN